MKKIYIPIDIEIVEFESEDIITTSDPELTELVPGDPDYQEWQ